MSAVMRSEACPMYKVKLHYTPTAYTCARIRLMHCQYSRVHLFRCGAASRMVMCVSNAGYLREGTLEGILSRDADDQHDRHGVQGNHRRGKRQRCGRARLCLLRQGPLSRLTVTRPPDCKQTSELSPWTKLASCILDRCIL